MAGKPDSAGALGEDGGHCFTVTRSLSRLAVAILGDLILPHAPLGAKAKPPEYGNILRVVTDLGKLTLPEER
jgi:hypothetical protein